MARDEIWISAPVTGPADLDPSRAAQIPVHVNDDNSVTLSYELVSVILQGFGYTPKGGA